MWFSFVKLLWIYKLHVYTVPELNLLPSTAVIGSFLTAGQDSIHRRGENQTNINTGMRNKTVARGRSVESDAFFSEFYVPYKNPTQPVTSSLLQYLGKFCNPQMFRLEHRKFVPSGSPRVLTSQFAALEDPMNTCI